jgi:putative hemolysin
MGELIPLFAVLPVLLVCSALASGSETALFCLSHADRARLRRDHTLASTAVEGLLSKPRALLIFVLLLNMTVNVAYFVTSSLLTTRLGAGFAGTAVALGSVLAIILFGEVLAKLTARAHRIAFVVALGPPMRALQVFLGPVVGGLDRFVIAPLSRVVGAHEPVGLQAAEVTTLIRAEGRGDLMDTDRALLEEVVAFDARRVREVMKPRHDLAWLEVGATPDAVRAVVARTGRSLLPVREPLGVRARDDGARTVGILHVKPYLTSVELGQPGAAASLARFCDPASFVPENARLDAALQRMRGKGTALLLCVDEHGDVTGWLEPEDIADELVRGLGEDTPGGASRIHIVGLGVWWVPGNARLHEVERHFGLDEGALGGGPGTRVTTIGGLVADRLGRVAEPGDRVEMPGATFLVREVAGRRVVGVAMTPRFGPLSPSADGGNDDDR